MRKRVLFIVSLVLLAFSLRAQRYDFSAVATTGQTLYYHIDDPVNHFVTLVSPNSEWDAAWDGFEKPTGSLVIPSSVTYQNESYTVIRLGHSVFHGCAGLVSITVPSSVSDLEWSCFRNCSSLSILNLPNSIENIGGNMFENTPWENNCPNGLYYIGTIAYKYYGEMSPNSIVTIRPGTTKIASDCFYGRADLVGINLPEGLVEIGSRALEHTGLRSVDLPNTLRFLRYYCFSACIELDSVFIPASVESIDRAFAECTGLRSIEVSQNNLFFSSDNNCLLSKDGQYFIQAPIGLHGDLVVPSSVKYMQEGEAFRGNHNITSVILPCGLEVLSLDYGYFQNTSLVFQEGCPNYVYDNGIIYNSDRTKLFFAPRSYVGVVIVPDGVVEIGENAFDGCRNISQVILPQSVTRLGAACFRSSGIQSIVFPNNIESIPTECCRWCHNLQSVVLPSRCKNIESSAFGDTPLRSVTIPDSVEWINCNAFFEYLDEYCVLEQIVLGKSLVDLGRSWCFPFSQPSIHKVICRSSVPPAVTAGEFEERVYSDTLVVPCGSLASYQSVYPWSRFQTILEDKLEAFVAEASSECSAMGSVIVNRHTSCVNDTTLLVAVPNRGYHFVGWTDGNTAANRIVMMTDTLAYYANFAINHYDVSISSNNESFGMIDQIVMGNYEHGTQFTITATPAEGCYFAGWSDGVFDNPRTFSISDNLSATANFDQIRYVVVCMANEWHMGSIQGSGSYLPGETVTLTAVPNDGYHFTGWSNGDTASTLTVVVPAHDTIVTANFAINYYTFAANSSDNSKGIVINYNNGSFAHGTQVHVQARAFNGYHLTQWSDGNTEPDRYLMLTGDSNLTAYFDINTYTVSVQPNDPSMGTTSGGGTFTFGETYVISATPSSPGVRFAYWQDGNNESPRTVIANDNINWVAYFENNRYYVSASSSDENLGFVVGGSDGLLYGSQLTITAYPQPGKYFWYWCDGNTENPRTISVTHDANMVAYFGDQPVSGRTVPYDFTDVMPTGQTLFFKIVDSIQRYVEIVSPMVAYGHDWNFYPRPIGDLLIPANATHNDTVYTIVRIGDGAFWQCRDLNYVDIEASVDSIKYDAFAECDLDSIKLPNTLRFLAAYAIRSEKMTHIHLPASLTDIHRWGWNFIGGSRTVSVTVDSENPRYASLDGALYTKHFDTLMFVPQNLVGTFEMPNTVRSYSGETSFGNIRKLVFSDNVTQTHDMILGENIETIVLGRGVSNVHAFHINGRLNVDTLIVKANNPPAFDNYGVWQMPGVIVVPCGVRQAYTSDPSWGYYSSSIVSSTSPETHEISAVLEFGESYSQYGFNESQKGSYVNIIPSVVEGCDSLRYHLNLNVVRHHYIDTTIDLGAEYVNGAIAATSPGVYADTIVCAQYDSVVVARVSMMANSGNPVNVQLASNIDHLYWTLQDSSSVIFMGEAPMVSVDPMSTKMYVGYSTIASGFEVFGGNLIVNGDFEQGDHIGFSSQYEDCNCATSQNGANHYDVWQGCGVDGSWGLGADGASDRRSVYQTTVPVLPGFLYRFSYMVKNTADQAFPPRMKVVVDGVQQGELDIVPQSSAMWSTFSRDILATGTTMTIQLIDDEIEGGGNDFWIDNIALHSLVPAGAGDTVTITNRHQINYTAENRTINQGEAYNGHQIAGIYFDTIASTDYDNVHVTRLSIIVNNNDPVAVPLFYEQLGIAVDWKCLEDSSALNGNVVAVPPMHTYHCVAKTSMRSDTIAVTNRHQYINDTLILCHTTETYLNSTIDSVGAYIFARNADTSIYLTVLDGWRYSNRVEDVMACAFPYTYEDQTWTMPGNYSYRHTSANACDSIVSITLNPKEVLLVDRNAHGANNGSSWTDAFTSLQAAIDASAQRQDKPDVWVAAGTYTGDSIYYHNAFVMKNHVNVYGGFAGNECSLASRQLVDLDGNGKVEPWEFAHATILDGQHVQRVLYQNEEDWEDTTTWDGFTIQNAYLTYADDGNNAHGAGVYMRNNGRIRNSIIQHNDIVVSGMGIGAGTYHGIVENCAVRYNGLAGSTSGGNHRLDGAGIGDAYKVDRCHVYGNIGYWGAGICGSTVFNSIIFDNQGGDGAGVASSNVYNSIIKNNIGSGVRYSYVYNSVVVGNTIAAAWDHWIYNSVVLGEIYPGYSVFNCAILGGIDATYNVVVSAENDGNESNVNYVRFVDPANDDYRLLPGSCLINAGNNDFRGEQSPDKDYYGYDRVIDGNIDIGISEYLSLPVIYDTITLCHGSINYLGREIENGGRYVFHLHEFAANDTMLVLQANSHKIVANEDIVVAQCALPFSHIGSDEEWTAAGSYRVVFTSPDYCDSILHVNLEVKDVIFVRPAACGLGDGSSWDNAMGNLQAAIDTAYWRQPKPVVWVASGTYTGDSVYYHSAFQMKEGVDVYGGFLPVGCTSMQRVTADLDSNGIVEPWEFMNPSILDGQHVQRVLEQSTNFATTTIWDGFTLQNANLIYSPKNGGGAMLAANGELRKCRIVNNRILSGDASGAGVYGGVVRESLFDGNGYTGNDWYAFGGGSRNSTLYSCKLTNNFAFYGGGGAQNSTLYNCIIAFNDADRGGGTEYCDAYNCIYYHNTSNWQFNTVLGGNIYNSILIGIGNYQEESHLYNCAIYGTTEYGANNIALDTANDGFASNVNYVRFVDPEHGDFRLLPGSACIDHGSVGLYAQANTVCPDYDYYGSPRQVGTLDIGIAEYDGAPVVVDTVIDCHTDYVFYGDTITQAGRYYHQEPAHGTYHIAEFHNKPTYRHFDQVGLCDNAGTYSYGDSTFVIGTESSIHDVHFSTIQGCDSTIVLTLNVHPTFAVADTLVLCDNSLPYTHNGNTLAAEGSYSASLRSIYQCDSVVATTLIVNPTYQHLDSAVICQSQLPFTYVDTVFGASTTSGTKSVHFSTILGCDSVISLNLAINPIYHHYVDAAVCDNQLPYQFADSICSEAGSYDRHYNSVHTCDSLVTFTLTVNSTYHHYDTMVICDNALPYVYGDSTLTMAGTSNVMFASSANCDSLLTVALTVHPTYQHADSVVLCQDGLPYTYGPRTFSVNTASGSYAVPFASIHNCDSTINLALTVNPVYHHFMADTICDNMLPYLYDGIAYGAGLHDIQYQSAENCDSLLTFTLVVNSTYSHYDTVVICDNLLPFQYGDSLFAASGTYNVGFSSMAGCDSIVALNFTANSTFHHDDQVRICESTLPYLYGDTMFYEGTITGSYTIPFVSVDGCDSIVSLGLTVNASPDQSICMVTVNPQNQNQVVWEKGEAVDHYNIYREGDITGNYELVESVPYGSISTWTDSTSNALSRAYSYKISAVDSCGVESEQSDLHHTMHLTISPGVNSSTWNLVWTRYEGASYSNYKIYRGYTNGGLEQIASIPTTSTSYTDQTAQGDILFYQVVIVLDEPCTTTKEGSTMIRSNVATNYTEGIEAVANDFSLSIYPNPTTGRFNVKFDDNNLDGVMLSLFDQQGRRVLASSQPVDNTFHLDITNQPSGAYYLIVVTEDGRRAARKVVKK